MENYTVEQLRQIARNKYLKGYSKLRKADLIKFIKSSKVSPKKVSPKKVSLKKVSPKKVSPKKKSPLKKKHTNSSDNFTSVSTRDKIINAKLKNIDWFIITMDGCNYCDEAKKLLQKNKLKLHSQMLTKSNKDKIYESIDIMTKKYRYFPIIFYKGKFLGGYTELKKTLEQK